MNETWSPKEEQLVDAEWAKTTDVRFSKASSLAKI